MLKELNQTDKFMTLIEADFRDADFIYKNYTFKDKQLKKNHGISNYHTRSL